MKSLANLLSLAVAALAATPTFAQIYPREEVIAWYEPFGYVGATANPRAVRMIASGTDGASYGGVSVAPGMVGTAFQFDGIDARVEVPDLGLFDPANFTIEAWLYWDPSANPDRRNFVVSQGDWASGAGWALMMNPLGHWHFHFNGSPLFPSPTLTLPALQWTHIALTRDAGGPLRFYQNTPGQPFASPSLRSTNLISFGSGPILIGNSSIGEERFGGRIDELTIYSRALTPAEVQAVFLAGPFGKEKPSPTAPHMLCWAFSFFAPVVVSTTSVHATEITWFYTGENAAGIVSQGYPLQTLPTPPPGLYDLYAMAFNDHGSNMAIGCFVRDTRPRDWDVFVIGGIPAGLRIRP